MFRRGFVRLNFGFGFDCREKLGGHHLGCALNHPLSDARDCAAYLEITLVADHGYAISLFEVEVA